MWSTPDKTHLLAYTYNVRRGWIKHKQNEKGKKRYTVHAKTTSKRIGIQTKPLRCTTINCILYNVCMAFSSLSWLWFGFLRRCNCCCFVSWLQSFVYRVHKWMHLIPIYRSALMQRSIILIKGTTKIIINVYNYTYTQSYAFWVETTDCNIDECNIIYYPWICMYYVHTWMNHK